MLSRRLFLGGIVSGVTLLSTGVGLGENEPAPDLKLFYLRDYIDPAKKPEQFRSINPASLPGAVAYKVWTTWCDPCLAEVPGYNKMAEQYKGKVTFVSVLSSNLVQQRSLEREGITAEEFKKLCITNRIAQRYTAAGRDFMVLISRITEQALRGEITSEVAREAVQGCDQDFQATYGNNPGSQPEERKELGDKIQELRRERKIPSFATYVLDHNATEQFLHMGDGSVPYTALFKDGTFRGGWHGSTETSVLAMRPRLEGLLR